MRVQPSAAPPGILVADDDEHLRFLLGLTLRQAGFYPLVAADGREAVALFVRHRDEIQVVLRFAMLVHAYWRARKARALSPPRG
jgi:DNA-binding response OmpR family regulator